MADDALKVWLYGQPVAVIELRQRRSVRLTYSREALETYALGTPLLSLRLPVTAEEYSSGVVTAFLEGLLPEGPARLAIAEERNIPSKNTFALTRELGRDCAGALVILPFDEPLRAPHAAGTATRLSESELAGLVSNLRSAPLGIGSGARVSLAGVQEKLVLTRHPLGGWILPNEAMPSTHILKPELREYPATVANEAFSMRVAKHLGLPVANVETSSVGGRNLIVVERYDRIVHDDGTIERVHQEDFCQAMGIPPTKKYQEKGGPALRQIAQILETTSTSGSVEELLRAVTLNMLIGNADAHGKNFSLLHRRAGAITLAPLYDVMSTRIYGENRLAMYIDGLQRMDRVTSERIVNEGTSWGIARRRAVDLVTDILDRSPAAADAAASETEGLPDRLRTQFDSQLAALRGTLPS